MYCIGADLGQAVDYSAIAAIEAGTYLDLRHIERLPLGKSYVDVVNRLVGIKAAIPGSRLVIDSTGVGRPVADMLASRGIEFIPVSITSGKETKCVDGVWRVPKKELMRGLVTALENGQLRIAKGLPYAEILKAELQDFESQFTAKGNVTLNGRTEHDDLVIAAALAVWGVANDSETA